MAEYLNRILDFSGHKWLVKSSGSVEKEGPGPNWFSDTEENVWLDTEGRLHMRITHPAVGTDARRAATPEIAKGDRGDDRWWCAEVVSERSFGHGRYTFVVEGGVETINENVVLGLFTWDTSPEHHNREIDIEISRWRDPENDAGQFVVQPGETEGNIKRFPVPLEGKPSVHTFHWQKDRVDFLMTRARDGGVIQEWSYRGPDNPPEGNEKVRINLWLVRGMPPSDGNEVEVVLRRFAFEQ